MRFGQPVAIRRDFSRHAYCALWSVYASGYGDPCQGCGEPCPELALTAGEVERSPIRARGTALGCFSCITVAYEAMKAAQ